MKNLIFIVVLLFVALGSYSIGRRHTVGPVKSGFEANAEKKPERRIEFIQEDSEQQPETGLTDKDLPFDEAAATSERGFRSAAENLEDAIQEAQSLPVSERMGFITGLFSFIARNKTPDEALKIYASVPETMKKYSLRALVAEWIHFRCSLTDDIRYLKRAGTFTISGSRLGLEAELSSMLASASPDSEITRAWLSAFSDHGSRSEIFWGFASRIPRTDADALLVQMKDWTSWEKDRVARNFLWSWAQSEPESAWDWYQKSRAEFQEDLSESIFSPWLSSDPEGVKDFLTSLPESAQKRSAIAVVGKALALKNTKEAAKWADGFANPEARETARNAVSESTPRGIGAVLKFEDGFTIVGSIVPGSPLAATQVRVGDRVVELEEADGTKHPLLGRESPTVINLIRGKAGSEVKLRILRRSEGKTEEHLVKVTRGQLQLDERSRPER